MLLGFLSIAWFVVAFNYAKSEYAKSQREPTFIGFALLGSALLSGLCFVAAAIAEVGSRLPRP